jgi:hypothetical protein
MRRVLLLNLHKVYQRFQTTNLMAYFRNTLKWKCTNVDDWQVWYENMFQESEYPTSKFKVYNLFVSWLDCW